MSDVESDDERMSVLEYARHHGLTQPYPLTVFDDLHLAIVPDSDPLADDECLVQAAALLDELEAKELDERLQVDKNVARTLVSLLGVETETQMNEDSSMTRLRRKQRYLELPILSTCNQLDMAQFPRRVRPDLTDTSDLPRWNDDFIESSLWPSQLRQLPSSFEQQIVVEKLSASREAIAYLSTVLRAEDEVPLETCIDWDGRPNWRAQCLIPPLLPLSPLLSHETDIPSSPLRKPPLPSEISESLSEEIQQIDAVAMCDDALQKSCSNSGSDGTEMLLQEVMKPSQDFSDSPQRVLPMSNNRKATELKMELPLTPAVSPAKSAKTVSFPEILHEYIPEGLSFPGSDGFESSPGMSALKEISPLAAQALKMLDHEVLIEADSTKRMDVPKIDFTLPSFPWEVSSLHGLTDQCQQTTSNHMAEFKYHGRWPLTAQIEREMLWNPLPSGLNNFEVSESIDCTPAQLNPLITDDVESIIDSCSLAWKRSGIRLLETNDLECETELLLYQDDHHHQAESRVSEKQHQQLHAGASTRSCEAPNQLEKVISTKSTHFNTKRKRSFEEGHNGSSLKSHRTNENHVSGAFFGVSSLGNFLELQNAQHHAEKPQVRMSRDTSLRKPRLQDDHNMSRLTTIQSNPLPVIASSSTIVQSPKPGLDGEPKRVVVNFDFLSQRHKTLRREIQKSYPAVQFVERDYSRTSIGGELRRHGNLAEADMAVSASTGLLWTTLQIAKQTSLPAQTDFFGIKERLSHVSQRYEHLIVLLSEGHDDPSRQNISGHAHNRGANPAIDSRDCWVFEELVAYASTLESSVHIIYVPGGEEELGRWIGGVVRRYGECGDTSPAIPLLHEETQWEIILRHLGLNAVAAQVVLATLKKDQASIGVSDQKPSKVGIRSPITDDMYGLSAFVCMSPAERIQRFKGVSGDGRLMERINRVLDQQWMSASHDLRVTSEGDLHHPSQQI